MANLEHSKSWNPEPWSAKLNSLIVTFHFTKTKHRSEKTQTQPIY